MQFGFVKAAAATPEIRVADCRFNGESIKNIMKTSHEKGVKILVLPELCITGCTCGDLFLQKVLLDGALKALCDIKEFSKGMEMLTVAGVPLVWNGGLYNCAVVIYNGSILGVVPKKTLKANTECFEQKNFLPAPDKNGVIELFGEDVPFGSKLLFACRELKELRLAVELGEDLWFSVPPSNEHTAAGALIIANLSASGEVVGIDKFRRSLTEGQSARTVSAYIYADAGEGESTTDAVFSGHNIIAEYGSILAESKPFGEGFAMTEIDVDRLAAERLRTNGYDGVSQEYTKVYFSMQPVETTLTRTVCKMPFIPSESNECEERCEQILSIQSKGLKRRLEHSRSKTAVIGISGGLDSCLALLAAVKAIDEMGKSRKDVIAVTMPCFGTTQRTKSNAELLCERLGVTLMCIDIGDAVKQHFKDIGHDFEDLSVVFENAQARERTQVLMDVANQKGGMVVGTGDLSELALGWATYNGDHMSMYGVNADIPKTLIRCVVHHYAQAAKDEQLRNVLIDILETPVSPELLPAKDGEIAQITEDLVGPYELHDFFLYYIIRWAFTPKKVFHMALNAFEGEYDRETLIKWIKNFYRRFFMQQFKRSCLPDGPKVGSVSLSPRGDWRMPSDACSTLWMQEAESLS